MPNIQFLGALVQIAFRRKFRYQPEGIFDRTHLRFFTRDDMDEMLLEAGWNPDRHGARRFGRVQRLRRWLGHVSGGRSDQWLAEQLYVAAGRSGPAPQGRR